MRRRDGPTQTLPLRLAARHVRDEEAVAGLLDLVVEVLRPADALDPPPPRLRLLAERERLGFKDLVVRVAEDPGVQRHRLVLAAGAAAAGPHIGHDVDAEVPVMHLEVLQLVLISQDRALEVLVGDQHGGRLPRP